MNPIVIVSAIVGGSIVFTIGKVHKWCNSDNGKTFIEKTKSLFDAIDIPEHEQHDDNIESHNS